jgi:DNA invertase Pin-like site-specific DNA recombinase
MKDLGSGDHVIVARLDRLTRNFLDFAFTIDTWSKQGVTLHPCDFPMVVRPDEPLSNAFIHMLAIFAQHERRLIGQRIREAKAWHKSLGRKMSPDPPWGFKHVKRADGHSYREEDAWESEICLKAAKLALGGFSHGQIAVYLGNEWGVINRRQEPGRAWNRRPLPNINRPRRVEGEPRQGIDEPRPSVGMLGPFVPAAGDGGLNHPQAAVA